MDIQAIIFDLDDTLSKREDAAYRCYRDILKEFVDSDDPIYFEAMVQDVMNWEERGHIDKNIVKDRLKNKYGIELPYENLNTYWDSVLWQYTVLFEDTIPTLEKLKEKYKLGIITNGAPGGQMNKIKTGGLEKYMDAIMISGDYPFAKPDKRIFIEMSEKLGVKPEECVFVGDSFYNDVMGAYQAGMQAIWMWAYGNRPNVTEIPTIHALSELLNYY